jgi:hypothetical protein
MVITVHLLPTDGLRSADVGSFPRCCRGRVRLLVVMIMTCLFMALSVARRKTLGFNTGSTFQAWRFGLGVDVLYSKHSVAAPEVVDSVL